MGFEKNKEWEPEEQPSIPHRIQDELRIEIPREAPEPQKRRPNGPEMGQGIGIDVTPGDHSGYLDDEDAA